MLSILPSVKAFNIFNLGVKVYQLRPLDLDVINSGGSDTIFCHMCVGRPTLIQSLHNVHYVEYSASYFSSLV